jgi:tRNA A-37 threonylcarbamoyl transferase component Bud32
VNSNPFYHLQEMDRVEYFYNRHSEVRDALDILHTFDTVKAKGNVQVTGPRRIGKTWFLHYISHPIILQEHGIDPQRNICAYIDCQHRSIQQKEAQVYNRMSERIIDAARRIEVDLVPEPCDGRAAGIAFEQALKKMHRRGLRAILLLDEFEVMARNPNLDVIFFNHLRALANADDVNVAYVTASSTSLVDLCLERESLLSSPFFNIFQPIRLGLFSEQDSQHLVEDSLRRASTHFPDDLAELVLEVGGRHPFFLQMAGHHAFRLAVTGEKLTEDERKTFMEKVNKEAARHFKSYWQKLEYQDQYVLTALPSLWQDRSYRETVEHLRDEGLIVQRHGQYDYFSPLFETFVQRQKVKKGSKRVIGRILGSVRIVEKIGSGGMATVYKGYQRSLDRYVAVKILSLDAQSEEFLHRFQQEAKAIAKLQHPNILPVHEFGQEEDLAYIVMDHASGGTLGDLIHSSFDEDELRTLGFDSGIDHGDPSDGRADRAVASSTLQSPFSAWLRKAIDIVIKVGEALHYAHKWGIVHRDVKPANILMTPDGRPLLADFGLVKILEASEQLTKSGIGIGTVAYMAPEQASGEAIDPRIDVYALGVVLYEIVTGHLPFEAESGLTVVLDKLQKSPPSPRRFNSSLPVEIEEVILKAIATRPEDRYQSALEMIKALKSVIS